MLNSSSRCPGRLFKTVRLQILFLLIFAGACQPAQAPASPTALPTLVPAEPTLTETSLLSPPTLTEFPVATESAQPVATQVPGPLSEKGPWLVYKIYYDREHPDYEYFIVNQDGTGRTSLGDGSRSGEIQASPFNRMVSFPGGIFLFDPTQMEWASVHSEWYKSISEFTGNNEKGLLADLDQATEDAIPELLIYDLPGGKVRDRFPVLFQCPADDEACDTSQVEWRNFEMEWSPNGRYLAFAAALENQHSEFGPSTDLYLYDAQTRNVLRLTNGPDSVSLIAWSPDGEWIIMGELHESPYPYTTSLWAVSPANGEMSKLYSLKGLYPPGILRPTGFPQDILAWLDDSRFLVYGGTSLNNAFDLPDYGLQLVDLDTGKVTLLVDDVLLGAALDKEHETIAVHIYDLEKGDQGVFLVSAWNTKLRYVGPGELGLDWDDQRKLFLTYEPCESDPQGRQGFDYKGEWYCAHAPLLSSPPSPDGNWKVWMRDGTWLKAKEGEPVLILQESPTQVIWRTDSQGFFFIADQILYYVPIDQAAPVVVDEHVKYPEILYKWVE